MKITSFDEAALFLNDGGIGVTPTDTLYGLVASALDPDAVERVYRVRGRDEGKPCIVLIADISELEQFNLELGGSSTSKWLERLWPGKVSMILPCPDERFAYLHRGTGTIAFRLPDKPELREFLRETGPLIAPSANPQGMAPAKTVVEAEAYFGDDVDFYVDGGMLAGEPSTVVKFEDEKLMVIREGAVRILNQES
jgi:L-threonylcarbamoyladenylate synthase